MAHLTFLSGLRLSDLGLDNLDNLDDDDKAEGSRELGDIACWPCQYVSLFCTYLGSSPYMLVDPSHTFECTHIEGVL